MDAFIPIIMVSVCCLYLVPVSECLSCYDCSPDSQHDLCTDVVPGLTRNVSCSGRCYVTISGSSFTRGCIEEPEQECPQYCCDTDLCNTAQSVTPPPSRPQPVECYQCTYRNTDGEVTGHHSCSQKHFDPLHPLVKIEMCPFGCSASDILAEDDSGYEYIISRGCAVEGYCENNCVQGAASCTTCCRDKLCNGREATPLRDPEEETGDGNQCYSCSYIRGPSGEINSPGCYEPFNASGVGIEKVPCSGECSLEIIRHDENSLVVRRMCQPGCNESCTTFGESENCRYCCNGTLCNSATNFHGAFFEKSVIGLLIIFFLRTCLG